MKKISFFIMICLLFALTSPALAVEAPGQVRTTRPETAQAEDVIQEQTQDAGQEQRTVPLPEEADDQARIQIQQIDDPDSQSTEHRIQAQQQVTAIHANRLQRRFNFYYQRLTKIADKIEARFDLLEAEGVDMTEARAGFSNAMLLLEEAREKANNAVARFEAIDPEEYQAQRQIALTARDEALQARDQFQQVVSEMIAAVQSAMGQAE